MKINIKKRETVLFIILGLILIYLFYCIFYRPSFNLGTLFIGFILFGLFLFGLFLLVINVFLFKWFSKWKIRTVQIFGIIVGILLVIIGVISASGEIMSIFLVISIIPIINIILIGILSILPVRFYKKFIIRRLSCFLCGTLILTLIIILAFYVKLILESMENLLFIFIYSLYVLIPLLISYFYIPLLIVKNKLAQKPEV